MQPGKIEEKSQPGDALNSETQHPATEHYPPVKPTHYGKDDSAKLGAALSAPEKVGPFRVGHQISLSDQSAVFAGTSLLDGRSVVLKFPDGWGSVCDQLAKQEFRALKKLQGPGVIAARSLLKCGARSAVVTETLQRRSLISRVRGATPVGILPNLAQLTSVCGRLLTTLHRIHQSGWVHGSIRAEHILFDEHNQPVLINFSHATPTRRPSWYPAEARLVANSPYLAPELVCAAPDNSAADMFAMGRLLAYLLSGSMPRWFPGEAMVASDLRLQSQLPRDTPRHLIDLCARLVRMASVQRPTAAMAYEALMGHPLEDSVNNPSSTASAAYPDTAKLEAVSRNAFNSASNGVGSINLLTVNNSRHADSVDQVFENASYDDARLILTDVGDTDERIPLPGFDGILHSLSLWFHQLTSPLRTSWRAKQYPSLRYVSENLAKSLGQPSKYVAMPTEAEVHRAGSDVIRLLTDLSQQRTLVLILHQIEQFDSASARILLELAKRTNDHPIILVCTTNSKESVANNPVTAPLLEFLS